MDEITRKIAEAGLIDKHALELLKMWGMPVDPDVAKEHVTEKLETFVREIEVLIRRDEEGYPPEVRLEEGAKLANPKAIAIVSDVVTTSTHSELKVVYKSTK